MTWGKRMPRSFDVDAHYVRLGMTSKRGTIGKPAEAAAKSAKYGNRKTNGYASKKEANRADELRLLEKAGTIRNLREQVVFELIPKQVGERACSYVADFVYEEYLAADGFFTVGRPVGWLLIAEDAKGVRTRDYVIKRKLMLQRYGIRIRET